MYDLYPGQRATGAELDQTNILDPRLDLNLLRARVGGVPEADAVSDDDL